MSPNDPAVEIHSWPPASNGTGWLVSNSPSLLWTSTVVVVGVKWLARALNNDVGCDGFPDARLRGAAVGGASEVAAVTAAGGTGMVGSVFTALASESC